MLVQADIDRDQALGFSKAEDAYTAGRKPRSQLADSPLPDGPAAIDVYAAGGSAGKAEDHLGVLVALSKEQAAQDALYRQSEVRRDAFHAQRDLTAQVKAEEREKRRDLLEEQRAAAVLDLEQVREKRLKTESKARISHELDDRAARSRAEERGKRAEERAVAARAEERAFMLRCFEITSKK